MCQVEESLSPDLVLIFGEQVAQAARNFAEALAETPQFQAWEQAVWAFRRDQAAQSLSKQLQTTQRELGPLLMLGAAGPEQNAELERLQSAYLALPIVAAYLQAEADLRTVCQATNEIISQAVGMDFAASCASRCCG